MRLDDETAELMKKLGINVDTANFEDVSRWLGIADGPTLKRSWDRLAAAAAEGDDWDEESQILALPFHGPLPVEVNTGRLFLESPNHQELAVWIPRAWGRVTSFTGENNFVQINAGVYWGGAFNTRLTSLSTAEYRP